jgi:hypothetical protein
MAFKTVNHDLLFDKLLHAWIRGITQDCFRSDLSHRKIITEQVIKTGISQGSHLGPLFKKSQYYSC